MKNIVLIGFKNSGKTTLAKELSFILKKEFIDIDDIIKRKFFEKFLDRNKDENKLEIFDIFNFLKEEKFRSLESDAFFSIKDINNAVIATSGSAVLDDNNFKILKNFKIIIYLQTSIDVLKKRIFFNKNQKRSQFLDENFLLKTIEKRKSLYENLADITLLTDNKSPLDLAHEVIKKIYQKKVFTNKKS